VPISLIVQACVALLGSFSFERWWGWRNGKGAYLAMELATFLTILTVSGRYMHANGVTVYGWCLGFKMPALKSTFTAYDECTYTGHVQSQ